MRGIRKLGDVKRMQLGLIVESGVTNGLWRRCFIVSPVKIMVLEGRKYLTMFEKVEYHLKLRSHFFLEERGIQVPVHAFIYLLAWQIV